MPQPILGIKGTAEYVEASGNGTVESPYIPTVYVANPGSGGGGGISSTVSITGTLPSFATTPTFNIGTAPNFTFTNTRFIADAGTNLNTSLLALESGGNLAGINNKLPSSLTVSNNRLLIDGSGITQPVSLTSELGYVMFRNTGLTNSPQAIKTTPGFIMGWNFINVNTVPVYVKFYNSTVANTTVATSTPLLTLFVPPGTTGVPGVFFQEAGLVPQEVFSTAITIACVTGLADNNSTAPATPIHVSVRYK